MSAGCCEVCVSVCLSVCVSVSVSPCVCVMPVPNLAGTKFCSAGGCGNEFLARDVVDPVRAEMCCLFSGTKTGLQCWSRIWFRWNSNPERGQLQVMKQK